MIQQGMMTLIQHSLILQATSQYCRLSKFAKTLYMYMYFKFSTCRFYLFVWLAHHSPGFICRFVSVPVAFAEYGALWKLLTQMRPPSRPVKPPTFSVTQAPAAADDRGLSCKLRDPKLNKCVGD